MKCQEVEKNLSAYQDGYLPDGKRMQVSLHLDGCARCASRSEQIRMLRRRLRRLPVHAPPGGLTVSLQVIASREHVRRRARGTLSGLFAEWAQDFRLWVDNLMRPVAIPLAGGLASAVFLFSTVVPNVFVSQDTSGRDVPISLYTQAALLSAGPFTFNEDDVIVQITIDEQGRMVDYSLPASVSKDPALLRSIENNLLFTRFTPATAFGQPTSGKIYISFRKSYIDVKG